MHWLALYTLQLAVVLQHCCTAQISLCKRNASPVPHPQPQRGYRLGHRCVQSCGALALCMLELLSVF